MYDAKELEQIDNVEDLRYSRICDKSYFKNVQYENLLRTKSSFVPIENVVKID